MSKRFVESPHAAKAARECDLDHGKISLMDELLGEQHTTRLRHGDRGCSNVSAKKAAELPLANLKSLGQRCDVSAVEGSALDELQGPRHRRRSAAPCVKVRRTFRPAPQTRAKTSLLSGGSGRHKTAILYLWRPSGADGPAVDSGCLYASEESPVKAGVTCQHGSVTN